MGFCCKSVSKQSKIKDDFRKVGTLQLREYWGKKDNTRIVRVGL